MDPSLTKDKLLSVAATRSKMVDVGGLSVRVREVGALEFAEYGSMLSADRLRATATLIAACVINEDGQPMLSVDEAMQIAGTARVSMPLVSAILELSGITDEKEPDAS